MLTVNLQFNLFYNKLVSKCFLKLFHSVSTCKCVVNAETSSTVCILSYFTAM
jgi:hypothetical protein